jgi:hypothetical protein
VLRHCRHLKLGRQRRFCDMRNHNDPSHHHSSNILLLAEDPLGSNLDSQFAIRKQRQHRFEVLDLESRHNCQRKLMRLALRLPKGLLLKTFS